MITCLPARSALSTCQSRCEGSKASGAGSILFQSPASRTDPVGMLEKRGQRRASLQSEALCLQRPKADAEASGAAGFNRNSPPALSQRSFRS